MYDIRQGVVAGFSHGFRLDGPGISNEAMIDGLRRIGFMRLQIPLMLQHELADCVRQEDCAKIVLRIEKHRKPNTYLGMDEVALQCVECAVKNGYRIIYVLAFPVVGWHYGWYLIRKAAKEHGIKVKILWKIWHIPSDPRSEQWWTRKWWLPLLYGAKQLVFGERGR